MKLVYNYEEIKNIKMELCHLVDSIRNNPNIKKEVKDIANEMNKQIIYYDSLLNSLSKNQQVTDLKLIRGFDETERYIKEIKKYV